MLNLINKRTSCLSYICLLRTMPKKSKSTSANSKKDDSKTKVPEQRDKSISPITINKSDNIIISVLAKPGAKQNAITEISPEGVGVQINAPPTDGEANTELIKYIASVLKVRKSDVALERGFKSRTKVLKITGDITLDEVSRKILTEVEAK